MMTSAPVRISLTDLISFLPSMSLADLASSRSCICLKERAYHTPVKAIRKSQIARRVLNSIGRQEVKLSNDEVSKDKLLTDCGTDQECVIGGIVALGKFDALHIGHRELAIEASKIGTPFLLSFVGMEEVLGWPSRVPIVAKCDRKRVLSSWAPLCGNITPLEFQVEFSNVRHLTPREFVEKLSKDLRVSGVVAGENYRFGYKASGDARELVRLCKEYGLDACIVSHVKDKTQLPYNGAVSSGKTSSDEGQVSSTRVRHALAMRDMEHVTQLLGRKHRLVWMVNEECRRISSRRILVLKSCLLNLPPGDGQYDQCSFLVDNVFVAECRVVLDAENLNVQLYSGCIQDVIQDGQLISIEFG